MSEEEVEATRFRCLSIVVPAYNEEKTIADILERVLKVPLPVEKEIVVVDDGSTDATPELLDRLAKDKAKAIKLITSLSNQGKGAAVRLGLSRASGDYILIQDADRELSPEEIPRLLKPILEGDADVVLGSRLLCGRQEMFRYTYLCNRLLNGWANLLYGSRLTDIATGYKVFPKPVVDRIRFRALAFEWDMELVAALHRVGMRIVEVPISYDPRTRSEGKGITFWDGIVSAWTLLLLRFQSRSRFLKA